MEFNKFIQKIWANPDIKSNASKKSQKQISQIFLELNHQPKDVLVLGFDNSAQFALESMGITVATEAVPGQVYDTLLVLDEFFTYVTTEADQRQLIEDSVKLLSPGGVMLTSIQDYRNNPVHKRNLGDSSYINIDSDDYVIVEVNTPDNVDRQSWVQTNFVIENNDEATPYRLGKRRTLYFKQLAKYCNDAGCKQFGVLKEHFWKSPWRRSMEHIAWSRF